MAVARDDLGRAARKRGIEGQVTIIRHFGIRCIHESKETNSFPGSPSFAFPKERYPGNKVVVELAKWTVSEKIYFRDKVTSYF